MSALSYRRPELWPTQIQGGGKWARCAANGSFVPEFSRGERIFRGEVTRRGRRGRTEGWRPRRRLSVTEQEWAASTDLEAMLEFVRDRIGRRRLRLFDDAVVRAAARRL